MQYEYRNKEIIVIFDYFDQRKLWDMIRECDTASGGVTPQTPADEFPGGVRFVLAFLGKIVYTTLVHAGVLELVDEVDSKSHSSVVTTSAEALDFSRKFDNSICKRFLMSPTMDLRFLRGSIRGAT